jgi:hypothetical protein
VTRFVNTLFPLCEFAYADTGLLTNSCVDTAVYSFLYRSLVIGFLVSARSASVD